MLRLLESQDVPIKWLFERINPNAGIKGHVDCRDILLELFIKNYHAIHRHSKNAIG